MIYTKVKRMPVPAGHRVIVKPLEVEEMSPGGIVMAASVKDRERDNEAQTVGILVAIGFNAWKAFDGGEPWAKVGDEVIFTRHSGYAVKYKDQLYRVINDENVSAVIPPEDEEISNDD